MKYYNPNTCKRPAWSDFCATIQGYIMCQCGTILQTQQITFEHWQQGHFDIYEKVLPKTREVIQELAEIGCIPPLEKK